jgi:hypothetical protein
MRSAAGHSHITSRRREALTFVLLPDVRCKPPKLGQTCAHHPTSAIGVGEWVRHRETLTSVRDGQCISVVCCLTQWTSEWPQTMRVATAAKLSAHGCGKMVHNSRAGMCDMRPYPHDTNTHTHTHTRYSTTTSHHHTNVVIRRRCLLSVAHPPIKGTRPFPPPAVHVRGTRPPIHPHGVE